MARSTTKTRLAARRKNEVVSEVAKVTGLARQQVLSVMDATAKLATADLKSKKLGKFVVPGLGVTLKRVIKPAQKAGKRIIFGNEVQVQAKPARTLVKALVPKSMKDAVAS